MAEDSGRLLYRDRRLSYESATYGSWTIEVSDIRLVGEFTNQNGPYWDDYFLVFFLKGSDEWFSASFYADGRDYVLTFLSAELPGLQPLSLCNSTDFKSHTLWPPPADDRPLFDFRPIARGDGFLNRMLDRFVPGFILETILRDEFKVTQAEPGATDNPDDVQ